MRALHRPTSVITLIALLLALVHPVAAQSTGSSTAPATDPTPPSSPSTSSNSAEGQGTTEPSPSSTATTTTTTTEDGGGSSTTTEPTTTTTPRRTASAHANERPHVTHGTHRHDTAPLVGPPPERLTVRGMQGAWFYRPSRGGRQRVMVYLHARNANPRDSCQRWHESTPAFGWLLCPIGQVDRGGGRREWANNADYAHRESMAALDALFARFPRRVRRHDNVIMGFSEGAFCAMNVGLREPQTFPRWFIIAANDGYIDGEGERIRRAAGIVRRIYLLTGENDGVVDRSRRAYDMLARVWGRRRIRLRILDQAGHELPPEFRRTTRRSLLWITQ